MKYAMISRTGERELNEDAVGAEVLQGAACFVLCDGLGGHDRGEVASQTAVQEALERFRRAAEAGVLDPGDCLRDAFSAAQDGIFRKQKESRDQADMKTTMTVLLFSGNGRTWGHIGDSRVYRFRAGKLLSRTRDHSVPEMLVKSGEIKESQIRFHEDRNRLLRVLGTPSDTPRWEIAETVEGKERDAFLLCTDGFWEWITEREMTECIRASRSPGEWLSLMEKRILSAGQGKGMDNYSAIAVWQGEAFKAGGLFGLF